MSYQHQVLGTVISSVLNYDQLSREMDEPAIINNARSTYAPCDGRSIVGSKLETDTNHTIKNTPDLRGRFIRGLNIIYSAGEPGLQTPDLGDPQAGRSVMDYQADAFREHNHSYNMFNDGKIHDMSNDTDQRSASYGDNQPANTGDAGQGSTETRPRNIALYFYIKIN